LWDSPWFFLFLVLASVAIVMARRPDALLNPQFFAEDGMYFEQAYEATNLPATFFTPYSGQFVFLHRLVAALATMLPLAWAPVLFNAVALVIQVMPVLYLNSSRFEHLLPTVWLRLFASFLYLAHPDAYEIHMTIENCQFYLGFLGFLIIAAAPATTLPWRILDLSFLVLVGLSGLFGVLLAPVAFLRWLLERRRPFFVNAAVVGFCAVAQIVGPWIVSGSSRMQVTFGELPDLLAIIVGHLFSIALFGTEGYAAVQESVLFGTAYLVVVGIIGAFVPVYALLSKRAPIELKLFLLYGALALGAALVSPLGGLSGTEWWKEFAGWDAGGRYFFLPMLAWFASLLWALLSAPSRPPRFTALALICCILLVGIPSDFRHHFHGRPVVVDLDFERHAENFEEAAPGTEVTIPLNPPDGRWDITLEKK
jgi:hypothetical protein